MLVHGGGSDVGLDLRLYNPIKPIRVAISICGSIRSRLISSPRLSRAETSDWRCFSFLSHALVVCDPTAEEPAIMIIFTWYGIN